MGKISSIPMKYNRMELKENTMSKVYVNIKVRAILNINEGVEVSEVVSDMTPDFFLLPTSGADIEDTEIYDYEITDSK